MNTPKEVLVIGAVATAGFVYFGKDLVYARRARSWPTVAGRVVDSKIETIESSDGGSASRRVKVRYTYSVGGHDYESDRVTFFETNMTHKSRELTAAQLAQFPKGATVKVHYDPADPKKAVLDAGRDNLAPRAYYFLVGLTGFAILMSLLMAVRLAIGR